MSTSASILRVVSRRANNLSSTAASHSAVRSFSATAPAALASTVTSNEADTRVGAAAVMAAAAVAGAGVIGWQSDSKKADCAAIAAVVGKDGFGARCVG